MELAQASCALIEEPVFPMEHLQTFKTIAEGAPTDVSVKNKSAATVPLLPIVITANILACSGAAVSYGQRLITYTVM